MARPQPPAPFLSQPDGCRELELGRLCLPHLCCFLQQHKLAAQGRQQGVAHSAGARWRLNNGARGVLCGVAAQAPARSACAETRLHRDARMKNCTQKPARGSQPVAQAAGMRPAQTPRQAPREQQTPRGKRMCMAPPAHASRRCVCGSALHFICANVAEMRRRWPRHSASAGLRSRLSARHSRVAVSGTFPSPWS